MIIKSTRPDGCESMYIAPDSAKDAYIKEIKEKGHTNIYNSETGQKY